MKNAARDRRVTARTVLTDHDRIEQINYMIELRDKGMFRGLPSGDDTFIEAIGMICDGNAVHNFKDVDEVMEEVLHLNG